MPASTILVAISSVISSFLPTITSFVFGDEVEYIPSNLCAGMNKLTSITIPSSVTKISSTAFSGCTSLTSIVWNAKDAYVSSFSVEPYGLFEEVSDQITSFVFGNNVCEVIKGDKVKEKIDVSVNTPYKLYISDNNTAVLVLSKYSSTTQKIIKVFNKSGKELFTQEIDGMVKSVSTDGKYVSVLTNSNVQTFTMKGKPCGSAEVNADAQKVLVNSRNTYVYSLDKIQKYSSVHCCRNLKSAQC